MRERETELFGCIGYRAWPIGNGEVPALPGESGGAGSLLDAGAQLGRTAPYVVTLSGGADRSAIGVRCADPVLQAVVFLRTSVSPW